MFWGFVSALISVDRVVAIFWTLFHFFLYVSILQSLEFIEMQINKQTWLSYYRGEKKFHDALMNISLLGCRHSKRNGAKSNKPGNLEIRKVLELSLSIKSPSPVAFS